MLVSLQLRTLVPQTNATCHILDSLTHCCCCHTQASDESDELELALKSQAKKPRAAATKQEEEQPAEVARMISSRKNRCVCVSGVGKRKACKAVCLQSVFVLRWEGKCTEAHILTNNTHYTHAPHRLSADSNVRSSLSSGHTRTKSDVQMQSLQAIMAAGPPRDMLSRMLYYLAQVRVLVVCMYVCFMCLNVCRGSAASASHLR